VLVVAEAITEKAAATLLDKIAAKLEREILKAKVTSHTSKPKVVLMEGNVSRDMATMMLITLMKQRLANLCPLLSIVTTARSIKVAKLSGQALAMLMPALPAEHRLEFTGRTWHFIGMPPSKTFCRCVVDYVDISYDSHKNTVTWSLRMAMVQH
jgi:hypothetical protein